MITTRPATIPDVDYLAERLRPADLQEIAAASGFKPNFALAYSLKASDKCRVGVVDGKPIGIYGVAPDRDDPSIGYVWMLATPALELHSVAFLRQSKAALADLAEGFQILTNWVDARNDLHIRWLRWCGFTFLRKAPYGAQRLPFYEFVKCVT